jgi:hypothetical protein
VTWGGGAAVKIMNIRRSDPTCMQEYSKLIFSSDIHFSSFQFPRSFFTTFVYIFNISIFSYFLAAYLFVFLAWCYWLISP